MAETGDFEPLEKLLAENVEELNREIDEKKRHIELLKQFREITKRGITEQEFHEYCKTGLNWSDELGKSLLNVFPFLKYKKRTYDCFVFQIEGQEKINDVKFSVAFPIYSYHRAIFLIPDLILSEDTIVKNVNIHYIECETRYTKELDKIKRYQKADSLSEKAEIMFPCRYRRAISRLWTILKVANPVFNKSIIARKNELTEMLEGFNRNKERRIESEMIKYKKQQEVIKTFAEPLLKWTNEIYVQKELSFGNFCKLSCQKKNGEVEISITN